MGLLKTARGEGGERGRGKGEGGERAGQESTPGYAVYKALRLKFSPQPLTVAFCGVLALDLGPGSILGDPELSSMGRNLPYVSRSVNVS